MNAVLDATNLSVSGLSDLVLLASIVLAGIYWRAHPTAARLAMAGLVCVFADGLLGIMITVLYPVAPIPMGSSDLSPSQWEAIELGGLTLHLLVNLVGALGVILIVIALLAEGSRSRATEEQDVEGVR